MPEQEIDPAAIIEARDQVEALVGVWVAFTPSVDPDKARPVVSRALTLALRRYKETGRAMENVLSRIRQNELGKFLTN